MDNIQPSYNKFSNFSKISYQLIKYLIDNDEEIWKLLYYADSNCWRNDNLTELQKVSLIYDGSPNETDFRVFMDVGADNSWLVQACMLRISPVLAYPNNYVFGTMAIDFECYCHYRLNHTTKYEVRTDMVIQRIIEIFNGAEIPLIGRLYFDTRASSMCKLITMGGIPYKGKSVVMCVAALG